MKEKEKEKTKTTFYARRNSVTNKLGENGLKTIKRDDINIKNIPIVLKRGTSLNKKAESGNKLVSVSASNNNTNNTTNNNTPVKINTPSKILEPKSLHSSTVLPVGSRKLFESDNSSEIVDNLINNNIKKNLSSNKLTRDEDLDKIDELKKKIFTIEMENKLNIRVSERY